MGASWRSSPRWIATSCAGDRCTVGGSVGGVEDRAGLGERSHDRHRRAPARGVSALRRGHGEGRLSLDQVGIIAARAGEGSDEHYAKLAGVATVSQLRTALKLEPRPEPEPDPGPTRSPRSPRPPTSSSAAGGSNFPTRRRRSSTRHWPSHLDALIAEWKHDHDNGEPRIR